MGKNISDEGHDSHTASIAERLNFVFLRLDNEIGGDGYRWISGGWYKATTVSLILDCKGPNWGTCMQTPLCSASSERCRQDERANDAESRSVGVRVSPPFTARHAPLVSETVYWTHRNHQCRCRDFGGRITKVQSLEMSIEGFRLNVRGASQLSCGSEVCVCKTTPQIGISQPR
jgi:hypothetical protein